MLFHNRLFHLKFTKRRLFFAIVTFTIFSSTILFLLNHIWSLTPNVRRTLEHRHEQNSLHSSPESLLRSESNFPLDIQRNKFSRIGTKLRSFKSDSKKLCRNSAQGPEIVVDERGFLCSFVHLQMDGCCRLDSRNRSTLVVGPNQLESNDYFLVGTKEGHILMYQLDTKSRTSNENDPVKINLSRFAKQRFRKPVVQLFAITELRILLSLSENVVTVHNLDKSDFPTLATINKTKGATCFAVDVAKIRTLTGEIQHAVRLCVVVKLQLLFFYWKKDTFHELRPNIKLSDVAKSIVWIGSFLYVAVRNQYIQVNCDTGALKDLFLTSSETLMAALAGNSSGNVNFLGLSDPTSSSNSGVVSSSAGLALCRERKTFIFDREAKPLLDYAITWSDVPVSIADDSLFLMAILSKDSSIEILTTPSTASQATQKIVTVQRIQFAVPVSISKSLKSISKWRNRFGQLILHSESDVVLLRSVPREQQIRLLQSEKYFELALKLVELDSGFPEQNVDSMVDDNASLNQSSSPARVSSPLSCSSPQLIQQQSQYGGSPVFRGSYLEDPTEKEKIKNDILHKQALDKFCSGDFRQAISIFQSLKTDPSYVIGLYPDLLPEEFRARLNYPGRLPVFEGAALDQGLMCLIDYLLEVRRKIKDDTSKMENTNKDTKSSSGRSSSFIAHSSSELSPNLNMTYDGLFKLQSIIDTSLLKCYLQTNDALAASLLRIPDNHCHLEEAEKALKKKQKYKELVILYKTKGLHKNALELLEKQAKFNDEQNKLINRRQLIEYLQELGPDYIDLIFQYSEWLIREYPDDGLSVFISDDMEIQDDSSVTALPREAVLEFLERCNSALVIPYLEHCIFSWNEQRSKFHDTLINKYRERIRYLMSEYQLELNQQIIENRIEILDDDDTGDNEFDSSEKQESHLKKSSSPESTNDELVIVKDYFLRPEPAGQEPNELGEYRRKLMRILQESNNYNTETLPTYLLHDGLFDERAIVMGKVGNHQEALMIYVHVLQDLQRAEEYCLRNESSRDVFLILLEQCLKTTDSDQRRIRKCHFGDIESHFKNMNIPSIIPRFLQQHRDADSKFDRHQESLSSIFETLPPTLATAIVILSRHSTRLDLREALGLLPLDLPLSAIIWILIQSLEHLNSRRNFLKILRQLLHSQRLRAHQSRIQMEQRNSLLVTPTDICQACMRKIGKSVFVCYTNRDLVHFGCRELYEQNRQHSQMLPSIL